MQATRRMRLQSVIRDELSSFISREIKDPRVLPLTLTQVEVSTDASQATIYTSLLGSGQQNEDAALQAAKMQNCLKGLASASGLMRRHLAQILTIRHIPNLVFKEDRGFDNVMRVQELLKSKES